MKQLNNENLMKIGDWKLEINFLWQRINKKMLKVQVR